MKKTIVDKPTKELPDFKDRETKNVTRQLACLLTQDEQIAAGMELTDMLNTIQELEEDLKRTRDSFKAKISAAQAQLTVIRNKVSSGKELRDVDCVEVYGMPSKGKKRVFRLDTHDPVATEDMTYNDLQRDLIPPAETEPPQVVAGNGEPDPADPEKPKRGRRKKTTPTNIIRDGQQSPDNPPINPLAKALPPGRPQDNPEPDAA